MRSILGGPRILEGRFVPAGRMGKTRRGLCLQWGTGQSICDQVRALDPALVGTNRYACAGGCVFRLTRIRTATSRQSYPSVAMEAEPRVRPEDLAGLVL